MTQSQHKACEKVCGAAVDLMHAGVSGDDNGPDLRLIRLGMSIFEAMLKLNAPEPQFENRQAVVKP